MKASAHNRLFILFRFLAEFTSRASSLFTFPLMTRYLGAEGYGVNAQTNVILSLLIPVATFGMGYGVVRLVAGKQDAAYVSARLVTTLGIVIIFSTFLAGVMFAAAPLLNALFIKVDWATEVLRWSAPLIILMAIEASLKDYYRARLRIIAYSVQQILQTVCYVGGVALVFANGGKLIHIIWFWLGIKAVFNLIALGYFLLKKEILLNTGFMSRGEIEELLRFGFPIVITSLSAWLLTMGDRWVIGFFMDARQVGIYNAAYTLAGILGALASPFWTPLYPLMAAHKNQQNVSGLYQVCRRYTNGYMLIGIPALIGLTILCAPLLVLVGTPEFEIHPMVFCIIAMGLFADQISANVQYLLYLQNEPGYLRNVTILSGILNLGLNLALVPMMGILGAAIATLIAYILLNGLLLRRVVSYGYQIAALYDFNTLMRSSISAVVMGIALSFFIPIARQGILQLGLICLVGAACYALTLLGSFRFRLHNLLERI